MYFKVLMEMGHVGSGKSFEITRFFEADNAVSLLSLLKSYPALKSKHNGAAIKLIEPASKEDFEKGQFMQQDTLYKKRREPRYPVDEKCVVEITSLEGGDSTPLMVNAKKIAMKGLEIKYDYNKLPEGTRLLVTIKSLNVVKKKAIVVWSNLNDGMSVSGLKWL